MSVEEEYCPLVNLFESAEAATAWAEQTGRAGEVLTVEEATYRGAAEWLPLLNPGAADRLNQARTPERRQLDHERAPVD